MSHIHWVPRQNKLETPKEKGEVKKREIHECDVWARDPDAMVDPPTPNPTYKAEVFIVVYYESRKRELKTWLMDDSRCDERLKTRVEESTCLTYTGLHDKTN
jgi:hypothetical protein